MKLKLTKETIESFLNDLKDPSSMNPIVVVSENDIQVQSDLYSMDEGYINFGRVEDVQEFFFGESNDYDYEELTEKLIESLIMDAYQDISWIEDAVNETIQAQGE